MTKHLELPKERNIYLPKQVDQSSMNDLTKSIIDINEHDKHLKKLYDVYGLEYKPKPIKMYIDSLKRDIKRGEIDDVKSASMEDHEEDLENYIADRALQEHFGRFLKDYQ